MSFLWLDRLATCNCDLTCCTFNAQDLFRIHEWRPQPKQDVQHVETDCTLDISTNSYLHAYITYNLRAMTWFKIASLHLVIPCRNDLKEKGPRGHPLSIAEYRLLPFSRTDTFGHFWTPLTLGALQHPAYMSFASQVMSQWIKRCYFLQRQGRLGKTPRLGPRGQFSEARSFHSFNEWYHTVLCCLPWN